MRHDARHPAALAACLAVALLAAAGCATGGQPVPAAGQDGPGEAADRTTHVIVNNESEWTLRVFALVGGAQYYLGSLEGYSQEAFEMPEGIARPTADFRLAAKATGPVRNYHSNTVLVEKGDTVRWTVTRSFTQTRAAIRVT